MRKSHTRISIIIEESMRGLADAHEELLLSAVSQALSDEDEDDSGKP